LQSIALQRLRAAGTGLAYVLAEVAKSPAVEASIRPIRAHPE
jgi:hypothetical protein